MDQIKKVLVLFLFAIFFCKVLGDVNLCRGRTGRWCSPSDPSIYTTCDHVGYQNCSTKNVVLYCKQLPTVNNVGDVWCVREKQASNQDNAAIPTRLPPTPVTQAPIIDSSSDDCEENEDYSEVPTEEVVPTLAPVPPTKAPVVKWPVGPVKAIYIDQNCWDASFNFGQLATDGYNLIILAFYLSDSRKAFDCAQAWSHVDPAKKSATLAYYRKMGTKILVSGGGATDHPYGSRDAEDYGKELAQFAIDQKLDGVDFDLEGFGNKPKNEFTGGDMNTEATIKWVVDATKAARKVLGPNKIITHAPQPPYFGSGEKSGWGNGYGRIYKACPDIDYFLVQFYNNGPAESYETIFLKNNGVSVSVQDMQELGVPLNKIVVGKPVIRSDIDNQQGQGFMEASDIATMLRTATEKLGWSAGVMGWQYHKSETNAAWINTIYPKIPKN